jgi:hypothetical protein
MNDFKYLITSIINIVDFKKVCFSKLNLRARGVKKFLDTQKVDSA